MSQTTFTPRTDVPVTPHLLTAHDRRAELIDLHCRAGHLVADLSEGPAWAAADAIVNRLVAEAEAVAGSAHRPAGADAPAVVRCRELAVAQRRMVAALDADAGHRADEGAVVRARALLAELGELADRNRGTLPR